MQQGIVAEKLSAGYGDTPVFQNLNLKILPGKITTLIGTNGSGKSTILKTLSRLLAWMAIRSFVCQQEQWHKGWQCFHKGRRPPAALR